MNNIEKYLELVPNATSFEKEVMQEMATHVEQEILKRVREDYIKWVLSDNYKKKYTGGTPFKEWKETAELQDMSNWD